jgi:hypothetical protein
MMAFEIIYSHTTAFPPNLGRQQLRPTLKAPPTKKTASINCKTKNIIITFFLTALQGHGYIQCRRMMALKISA